MDPSGLSSQHRQELEILHSEEWDTLDDAMTVLKAFEASRGFELNQGQLGGLKSTFSYP